MKLKLRRLQRYEIETHQDIILDIDELRNEEDLDNLFLGIDEYIISGDEYVKFHHPDNFEYNGYDIYLENDKISMVRYNDEDLPDWNKEKVKDIKQVIRNLQIDNLLKNKNQK